MALKKATAALLTATSLCLTAGCNTSGCLQNQSAIPLAGFYSSTTEEPVSLGIVQINGVGAPADSVLLEAGKAVSQVYLPMRSTASQTSWCLHYTQEGIDDPRLNDTISFAYDSEPYFDSEECGAMYRYRITAVSTTCHLIDSVAVTDSLISNVDIERIKIYFRISDDPDNNDKQ